GNKREVVERRPVIVAGIVVILAGAEKRGQKKAIHAFVVMQRLLGKKDQAKQGSHGKHAQATPPPEITRSKCAFASERNFRPAHAGFAGPHLYRLVHGRWPSRWKSFTPVVCLSSRLVATSISSWFT